MVMEANREESTAEDRAKLTVARPGLRFNEVMTGMITMGVTDPAKGYRDDAAIAMRLEATVTIPNLPGFIKDPIHKGQWRAAGSIPVLGGVVIGMGEGDFELSGARSRDMGVREMITTPHHGGRSAIQDARPQVRRTVAAGRCGRDRNALRRTVLAAPQPASRLRRESFG
jgi:hypothetical protein